MKKAPIRLQDLRRRIYVKAKAEPSWRFWGLYVHVGKMETLHEAYRLAKKNKAESSARNSSRVPTDPHGFEGWRFPRKAANAADFRSPPFATGWSRGH
jgi:RNA-directed DNA polymerase